MASVLDLIDTSRLPAPDILEDVSAEEKHQEFIARFKAIWAARRAQNPSLPEWDVSMVEADLPVVVSEAVAYLRTLDRIRVNDAVKAVLAPLAKGTNLDNVVANQGLMRLELVPADPATGLAAVMESDEQLLRRYFLSFEKPSAGSAERYMLEAWTAVPSLHDVAVIGHAIHGRRGDVDIVLLGQGGRPPTADEIRAVHDAIHQPGVKSEATAVSVFGAILATYGIGLTAEVGRGPDPALVADEARTRVKAATDERMVIGGEVPADLPIGAAYGPNILKVRWKMPFAGVARHPYTAPVCAEVSVDYEVRT